MVEWVEIWGPLVTLCSTVGLAIVTGWLAYVTKAMADSARSAAEQSRIAAEASLASVAAAEASVDVRFDLEPNQTSTKGALEHALQILELAGSPDMALSPDFFSKISKWTGARLTCVGATVTVHAFRIAAVTVQEPHKSDADIQKTTTSYADVELETLQPLPRLCHASEVLSFEVLGRSAGEDIHQIEGVVSYSFGTGSIREREVTWKKPVTVKTHPVAEPADRSVTHPAPEVG